MPRTPLGASPLTGHSSFPPLMPELWLLDPEVAHLNHGSYGAVPVPVLAAQRRAAEAIERSPERFYRTDLASAMDEVRHRTATFLNTDPEGLVLVQNATEAVQVVLDSLELEPRAEIVYTDQAYPWVKAAILRTCERRGAVPRCVALPNPRTTASGSSAGELVARIQDALNDRTALVALDQITSASAVRLPVEEVCAALANRVPVMLDGAHAPGLIDAPVPQGATFWFGNLHKWAFAARTAAALVVAPSWRERVHPLVASAGLSQGFPASFSYLGTQDPSAFLSLASAFAFPAEHLGMNFEELRMRNTAVLDVGMERLAAELGVPLPPNNGLPIRTLPLGRSGDDAAAWQLGDALRARGVEVAVVSVGNQLSVRVSVQAYVGLEEFDRLAAALTN